MNKTSKLCARQMRKAIVGRAYSDVAFKAYVAQVLDDGYQADVTATEEGYYEW